MAPEILYGHAYNPFQVDVFAAGVILFVLYSGHPPFNEAHEKDPYYRAFVKDNKKFWNFHSTQNKKRHYSEEFKQLLNNMLSIDPKKRASFEEIKNSAWCQMPVNEAEVKQTVAQVFQEISFAKEQSLANRGSDNRDADGQSELEELQNMVLPDITYEDIVSLKDKNALNNNFVVKSEDRQLLSALVLKKAVALGFKQNKDIKNKLVFTYSKENEGETELQVRFFELGDNLFQIELTRRTGDYFTYQGGKTLLQEAVKSSCM